jgi:hypothetical protein
MGGFFSHFRNFLVLVTVSNGIREMRNNCPGACGTVQCFFLDLCTTADPRIPLFLKVLPGQEHSSRRIDTLIHIIVTACVVRPDIHLAGSHRVLFVRQGSVRSLFSRFCASCADTSDKVYPVPCFLLLCSIPASYEPGRKCILSFLRITGTIPDYPQGHKKNI